MNHTNPNLDHSGNKKQPHGIRWRLGSVLHMVGMIGSLGDFWSSDLNRAAVDLVDPRPGLVVLDLGAGLGPATVEAAKRVAPSGRVIAVDPSSTMRRVLSLRRLWQSDRSVIDIRDGGAEVLPVLSGSIDAAWAVNAVHHFDDLALAVGELARALKPGGRLLLIEEDFTGGVHACCSGEGAHSHGPDPVDPEHLEELLSAAGLTVTGSDSRTVGGVVASVTTASKPIERPRQRVNRPGSSPSSELG